MGRGVSPVGELHLSRHLTPPHTPLSLDDSGEALEGSEGDTRGDKFRHTLGPTWGEERDGDGSVIHGSGRHEDMKGGSVLGNDNNVCVVIDRTN